MKVAFLDRDGTINRDYPDACWTQIQYPELLPGTISGLRHITEQGYKIIIITNQYIIGEGIISLEQYHAFTNQLLSLLNEHGIHILDVFYCPHARNSSCDCCKPKTGLIHQALQKYPDIDLRTSFMCGDSLCDLQCAEQAGLSFYGISLGEQKINDLSDLSLLI